MTSVHLILMIHQTCQGLPEPWLEMLLDLPLRRIYVIGDMSRIIVSKRSVIELISYRLFVFIPHSEYMTNRRLDCIS